MSEQESNLQYIAETVRDACIEAALEGYENAAISGLCREGAWEAAISSIRMVDIEAILKKQAVPSGA
ncbi:acetyltransferase [Motiliproteus sp. MSK22-1]|uniref:acetyltransferase n=1 Tax=Motiliproteus sp. MSK22-1 TaxID=1897630 RepID=UPI000976CFC0|nr:acetyltransferase [Motiliproteus sp. MSK22-1]OMH38074.1 acetyltransferase [Motiliproteus sp. MSK22-1]